MKYPGLSERLENLAPDRASEIARMTGIADSTMRTYFSGSSMPKADAAIKIAEVLGVNVAWLVTGEGPMQSSAVQDASIVRVEQLDIEAANGGGLINSSEEVVGEVSFEARWLRHIGMHTPSAARVITAAGSSNEPHIRHGDLLLVDTAVLRVGNIGFYVLYHPDGGLRVKLCQSKMDGSITIQSANPDWADDTEIVSAENEPHLDVRGLVRWYGRGIA